ncbi:MAG: hypothetical protein JJU09_07140 [Rhodobacteraceae bacterium]|nr:hypothetical protein [Paracoccaceae bacterium]TVR46159.1 MAG: hypothetical protein EA386_10835 [Paracoccaceae bacterium]
MTRPFPKALYLAALTGILVLALSPFLAGIMAETGAALAGCDLHVGLTDDCVLLGYNTRNTLYAIGMLSWLAPLGILFGAIGLGVWAFVLAAHLIWRRPR